MIDFETLDGIAKGRLKCGANQGQDIAQQLIALREATKRLIAFKEYVHQRLDEAGIPKDPPGIHSEKGCRVGQRLDLVLNKEHPRG